jgi:hypothetical protein
VWGKDWRRTSLTASAQVQGQTDWDNADGLLVAGSRTTGLGRSRRRTPTGATAPSGPLPPPPHCLRSYDSLRLGGSPPGGAYTFVSLNARLKGLPGPVSRVIKKKKKKSWRRPVRTAAPPHAGLYWGLLNRHFFGKPEPSVKSWQEPTHKYDLELRGSQPGATASSGPKPNPKP